MSTRATIADLNDRVDYFRGGAQRMSRAGYVVYAADYTIWADEAQGDLDAMTATRWTWRQRLEVAASVVLGEAVFAVVLWAAVLR